MSNIVTLIGDVHCKYNQYKKIIDTTKNKTVQIGDFGFKEEFDLLLNEVDCDEHKILFGNHDYYPYLDNSFSLKNYAFDSQNRIMTIRGAYSIDEYRRNEGVDWFKEEEMNHRKSNETFDFYIKNKPEIVISHCAPYQIALLFMQYTIEKGITMNLLQAMFDEYKPKMWIFGHYHKSFNEEIEGTRFICLPELATLDLTLKYSLNFDYIQ